MNNEQAINHFLMEFRESRCKQLEQNFIGTTIAPRYTVDSSKTPAAEDWRLLARAASGEIDRGMAGVVMETCLKWSGWLFGLAGPPHSWAESPVGAIWWGAYSWCKGDDLLTLSEAANLAGVSLPAISMRVSRGSLTAYIDPSEPNPQKRRRVSRREIEDIYD